MARKCLTLATLMFFLASSNHARIAQAVVIAGNSAAFNVDFPLDGGTANGVERCGPRTIIQFDLAAGLQAAGVITDGAGLTAALVGLDAAGNPVTGAIADVTAGLTVATYDNAAGNSNLTLDLSGTVTSSVFVSGVSFVALRVSTSNNNINTDGVQTVFDAVTEANDDCFVADFTRPSLSNVFISQDNAKLFFVFSEPLNTGAAANDVNHTVLANVDNNDFQAASTSPLLGATVIPTNFDATGRAFTAGSNTSVIEFTRNTGTPGANPINVGTFVRLRATDDAGNTANNDLFDRVGNRASTVPVVVRLYAPDLVLMSSGFGLINLDGNGVARGTIAVTNAGPETASQVLFSMPITSPLLYVGSTVSTGTPVYSASNLSWSFPALAPGATATITVDVDRTVIGTNSLTASVTHQLPDPTPADNSLVVATPFYSGDCNQSGVEDWLELATGALADSNGDFIPDVCDQRVTRYCNLGTYLGGDSVGTYLNYQLAVAAATGNTSCGGILSPPVFVLTPSAVTQTTGLSTAWSPTGVYLYGETGGTFEQSQFASWDLTANSSVVHPDPARGLVFGGSTTIAFGASVRLQGGFISILPGGRLSVSPNSGLELTAPGIAHSSGTIGVSGGAISAPNGLVIGLGGLIEGWGILPRAIVVSGNAVFFADTQAVENYTNSGTTTIQNGTLTIVGNLTNTGTIIGDFAARPPRSEGTPRSAGDGLFVRGVFDAGATSSLRLEQSGSKIGFGSDFLCAINDSSRFDLSNIEARVAGTGAVQKFEAMSLDRGAAASGFNPATPSAFPIGTLRVVARASALIDDTSDNANDGQGIAEAVYANTLIIESGATLNTNGRKVYCRTLSNAGTVIGPANLRVVPPACFADFNADGTVNTPDLTFFLGRFGQPAPSGSPAERADFDGSGIVDTPDLVFFLGRFGQTCP